MNILLWVLILTIIIVIVYFLGPKPKIPYLQFNVSEGLSDNIYNLEQDINQKELSIPNLKPDNQARIVWANPNNKSKTEYCIVYIHGFSASCGEGYPVNQNFTKRYCCNMYMARLAEHGIESSEELLNLTPENYLESAKEAVSIGRQIGKKVILMSTSTGGTLSLAIASENPWIHSLILFSPNIAVADNISNIFLLPWGMQIARLLKGKYNEFDEPTEVAKYWNIKYRLEAIRTMKVLIEATMSDTTFKKISQPLFLGYYYKNEKEQDETVSVKRMLEMFDQVSTPENGKRKIAFPDAGCHPIPSGIYNKNAKSVEEETYRFVEEILGMKPIGFQTSYSSTTVQL
jgi:pimeloyl-ACP methyl ester carboxylesterase